MRKILLNHFVKIFCAIIIVLSSCKEPTKEGISFQDNKVSLMINNVVFEQNQNGRILIDAWVHIFGGSGTIVFTNLGNDEEYLFEVDGGQLNTATFDIPNGNYDILLDLSSSNSGETYLPFTATASNVTIDNNESVALNGDTDYGIILLDTQYVDPSINPYFVINDDTTDLTLSDSGDKYFLYAIGDIQGILNLKESIYSTVVSQEISILAKNIYSFTLRVDSANLGVAIGLDDFVINEEEIIISGSSTNDIDTIVYDIDGNAYKTVTIGTQVWMAENLRTTRYANGDAIPNIVATSVWNSLDSGAWRYYNDDSQYENPYGRLYNWYTAVDSRNVCPTGWHASTDEEWLTLFEYFGHSVAGGALKEEGTMHWLAPNEGATNNSGFSGLPGGLFDGGFGSMGYLGVWWTSTEVGSIPANAWARQLRWDREGYDYPHYDKNIGASIRCVKD